MARTAQQSVKPQTIELDALVTALYERGEESAATPRGSILNFVSRKTGDAIADSRSLFASVAEGWDAGRANYEAMRVVERKRQMARTKQRLAALLEQ